MTLIASEIVTFRENLKNLATYVKRLKGGDRSERTGRKDDVDLDC